MRMGVNPAAAGLGLRVRTAIQRRCKCSANIQRSGEHH